MEKRIITREVKKRVRDLSRGTVITLEDFPAAWSRIAVAKALTRLCKEGHLVRHSRGVYSKSVATRFGVASAGELDVVLGLLGKERDKMIGGVFLFNSLGLTTQNTKTIEVLNNSSTYEGEIGNLTLRYRRIRPKITPRSRPYIELMEVLSEISTIADSNTSEVIDWTIDRASSLDKRDLMRVANEYGPRFRALLGALMERKDESLAARLKMSINPASKYRVGRIAERLENASTWGLSLEAP